MKLTVTKRDGTKKSDNNRWRREGKIPAVLYSKGNLGDNIAVDTHEFSALLRSIKQGYLPVTQMTLVDADGKERRVIVKGIQYHPTRYDVIHLDFEELHDDVRVNVKVPIDCKGVASCVGIKHGGVLRRVIRHVRVNCLPKDIPPHFEYDVQHMEIAEKRRLSDLAIPTTVRPLANLEEVAVVIAKR